MTTNKTGGPAFPVLAAMDMQGVYGAPIAEGMSLRDWFAGQIVLGLVASHEYGAAVRRIFDPENTVAQSGDVKETPQCW